MAKFYCRIPNSQIYPMVGAMSALAVSFRGNMLDTEDPELEATHPGLGKICEEYLLGIADRPGTGISSKSQAEIDAGIMESQKEAMEAAKTAQTKMVKAGERVV